MKKTDGDNEGFDLLTLARLRCSVRAYTSRAVESEKLEYILEAVRLAPSAVNFQPWLFIVIQNEKDRKKLQQCYEPRLVYSSSGLYCCMWRSPTIMEAEKRYERFL